MPPQQQASPKPGSWLTHCPSSPAQGNRTTPSYVAFTDSERLIGDAAKNQVRGGRRRGAGWQYRQGVEARVFMRISAAFLFFVCDPGA